MNNKAQGVWALGLMMGLTIIVLSLAIAPVGNEFVVAAMNQTVGDTAGLDCGNSSISNFDKSACVVVDFSVAYFFGGLILIGGLVLTARLVFN